jgi:hypothetical protein
MRFSQKAACSLSGLLFAMSCPAADSFGPFDKIENTPLTEVWLSTGFKTWHFDNGLGLNGHNPGWGGEYRYSTTLAVTGGQFYNSDWHTSNYLGGLWHPLAVGPFRFGIYAGLFDGYPRMQNGGVFAALAPVISAEYGRIGANLIIVPTIQDRLYGGISLQLKLKVY